MCQWTGLVPEGAAMDLFLQPLGDHRTENWNNTQHECIVLRTLSLKHYRAGKSIESTQFVFACRSGSQTE